MPQCIARSKRTGERCRNKAVHGYNVCRLHGAKGGRPVKHGMYSNKVNTSLAETYQHLIEETDNLSDLNEDIALLRAMMIEELKKEPDNEEEKRQQIGMSLRFMKDIRNTIELKEDIESKYMVSIETVQVFLNQLLFVLRKRIKDPKLLDTVMADMRQVKLLDQSVDNKKKIHR